MAGKTGLVVTARIDGVSETLAAFALLPREASHELRDASQRIAQALEGRIQGAARAQGRQAALVASTVKARRDRVPTVEAGGSRRVGRKRVPAHAVLFGSEFGASQRFGWYAAPRYRRSAGRQYRPHRGAASYWFFATVEANQGVIDREWNQAADEIIRRFVGG